MAVTTQLCLAPLQWQVYHLPDEFRVQCSSQMETEYDFMQCHCVALLLDTVGTSLLRTSPEAVLLFRPKEVAESEQALEPFVA